MAGKWVKLDFSPDGAGPDILHALVKPSKRRRLKRANPMREGSTANDGARMCMPVIELLSLLATLLNGKFRQMTAGNA